MAKKKGKHVSDAAAYKKYQVTGKHSENKIAKLLKILREQPNNDAIAEVLAKYTKNGVKYTRNRKPNLIGSKRTPWPTLKMDIDKHKKWLGKNGKESVPEWQQVLADGFKVRIPTQRQKNHEKHNRVSQ